MLVTVQTWWGGDGRLGGTSRMLPWATHLRRKAISYEPGAPTHSQEGCTPGQPDASGCPTLSSQALKSFLLSPFQSYWLIIERSVRGMFTSGSAMRRCAAKVAVTAAAADAARAALDAAPPGNPLFATAAAAFPPPLSRPPTPATNAAAPAFTPIV